VASLADLLTSRIPPHNLEAERAVLGSILLERDGLPRALELLRPDDFYKDGHRKIFEAMIALFDRSDPVDHLTLSDELHRRGEMEAVGGMAALAAVIDEASTAAHLSAYATIVRKKALLRELIRVATEVVGQSYEASEDVDHLLDDAERRIFALSERRVRGAPVAARIMCSLNR